jgi:mannose-6-phosphate isomerase-like protein (cupin superfamily)
MRLLTAVLLAGAWTARGEIRDVVKSAEIDRMFEGTGQSLEVLAKTNYAVVFRVVQGGPGAWRTHPDADEFWFVRRGGAKVSLRPGEGKATGGGERHYDVGAGDVLYLPRTGADQIAPGAGRFEYVVVRVFPEARRSRIGIGAAPEPRPMPEVATKARIDATFAGADKNVLLHSAGAALINHVVYLGAHGPWEVHQACDDLYFVRMGTARARLDGTLVEGKEDPPGEIRGIGVTGAREFTIGPGDMVVVPRNTAHFMDPGSAKLGYLLVKVCD